MILTARLRAFYILSKPGIIRGNLITAAAGFFLASKGDINVLTGFMMLLGLGLIIASACVTNNYLDREMDKKMVRTAKRALATGAISGQAALVFAAALGTIGALILFLFTTSLALISAGLGWVAYVVVYGYYKRRSTLGTAVGSISGAIPPVVGYVAVINQIDTAAVLLFLILVFWQMPHFFAIAIYRLKDYTSAGLPVLPVKKGLNITRVQMVLYILGYILVSLGLTVFGYTSLFYAVVMLIVGAGWLYVTVQGYSKQDNTKWAKKVFLFSLLAITIQCLTIAGDATLS